MHDPVERQVTKLQVTARQEASARHAARASASVGKLAIWWTLGQSRSGICGHYSTGLPAHIPAPQHAACVRPAYVVGLATRVPLPQPPRSLHGVKSDQDNPKLE